jgi:Glycerophosphoryl diester phosphodiesterase family
MILAAAVSLLSLVGAPAVAAPPSFAPGGPDVRPLAQAHAHNDYEHDRPLFDALDHGFTSVEADVWPVDGDLLVAHDEADLRPDRNLRALYLDPLADRVRANHGKVYRGMRVEFQLLVDIKAQGALTYQLLDQMLREPRYAFMFTSFTDGKVRRGAVTVVISGDRPREVMAAQRHRLAFYDGRIVNEADLGPGDDARLTPLVSDNWTRLFTWSGEGPMPAAELARLTEIVHTAHAAGQRVRFWATPDAPGPAREAVWRELLAAAVDHINTDDLAGLEAFLRMSERAA